MREEKSPNQQKSKKKRVHQGEVYMVVISDTVGSEQDLRGRPCIIVQNEVGNEHSKTTIIVPLTKRRKRNLPTHYLLKKEDYPFLGYDSLVLAEQIRCIDSKARFLERKIGELKEEDIQEIIKIIYNNFV